ncbi:ABC transporter ATP-binding protein [Aquimixticola soesokkakensis]
MLFMALEGSVLGILSYFVQPMFDNVLVGSDGAALKWVALGAVGILSLRAVSTFTQRNLMASVQTKVSTTLQADMVAHMLTLDGDFYQDNTPGVLIERTRGDTLAASTIWNTVATSVGRDMVSLISLLGVALYTDWTWTLIAVAGAPLVLFPITVLQKRVRRATRAARAAAATVSNRLDEIFHGAVTIKLSATEKREAKRFGATLNTQRRAELKAVMGQAAIPGLIDLVAGIGLAGVLYYGGGQIVAGEKTVGEFMSFFTAIALVFEPLRRVGNISGTWQVALGSIERIHGIFEAKPTIKSPATPVALAKPAREADITLANVSFAYGTAPVLRGATFTARAGETTALVGASGAGKSTVFNLLTRLVDATDGEITIGGQDIRTLALPQLRNLYSVVSQETLLFDESLRDNITMGETPDPAQLTAAMDAAHVSEFVQGLGNGLDTAAGPRGSALSGGQRQRIAIARAVLRDRPVLLLDEATSALDARSEKIVQEALERLSKGRTTLVIAHRLSTIRAAHSIVVMDRGRVVDQGTHEELLARGGIYADLYRLQYSEGKTVSDARAKAIAAPDAAQDSDETPSPLARMFSAFSTIWKR